MVTPIQTSAFFSYKPSFTEAMARDKIAYIQEDYPNFLYPLIAYNDEGVAVFGFDESIGSYGSYCLLWASPSDKKVKMIDCSKCSRLRDGGTSFAISRDKSIRFEYTKPCQGGEFYINDLPAQRLRVHQS